MQKMIHYSILMLFLHTFMYGSQQENIIVRAANLNDLAVIAALTRAVFYEDFKPIILEGYADNPIVQAGQVDTVLEDWLKIRNEYAEKTCLNTNLDEKMIVAEDHSGIVGICNFEKKPEKNAIYISFMGTNKIHRRRGIGTQLLSQSMKTFDDVKICELATLAHANQPVQEFYEKRDFVNKGLVTIDPRVTNTHYLYQRQLEE
jgi:ribosomal protein S18 acetylase RimI-like enzyme